ncbi:MAG: pseudouridine synthase [bacterium]|nr:pseudouridine synthase [bacterium]
MMIRINKYLSEMGVVSRREADRLIEKRKVKINGHIAKLGDRVDGSEQIEVEGHPVRRKVPEKVYLAYNKPAGVIVTSDRDAKDNILAKVRYPGRVFPVGRLDVKTSGLILLTNDGDMVNKILKGENKVEKEYIVQVDKIFDDKFLKKLRSGIVLEGFRTLPARVAAIDEKRLSMVIVEGKKRQIRRMCEMLGYQVVKLARVRIGGLKLEDLGLRLGSWTKLREEEVGRIF